MHLAPSEVRWHLQHTPWREVAALVGAQATLGMVNASLLRYLNNIMKVRACSICSSIYPHLWSPIPSDTCSHLGSPCTTP